MTARIWRFSVVPAVAAALVVGACETVPPPPAPAEVYTNERYGYTIEYPDTLDMREYTPEYVAVGRADGEAFAAAVELALDAGAAEDFQAFAVDRARQACAADGGDLSLECTDVQSLQPFTTTHGEKGIELFLRHVTTRAGTAEVLEESTRGPFFAFDLSARVPAAELAVLFVRAPVVLPPHATDTALVRAVAASLGIPSGAPAP